jgi:hypothetical protein
MQMMQMQMQKLTMSTPQTVAESSCVLMTMRTTTTTTMTTMTTTTTTMMLATSKMSHPSRERR